jgi:putative PIN family toxin of toxin-antitoxin system
VRIVADSNTLVSAVLWGGLPSVLLDLAKRGKLELFTSRYILMEVDQVMRRPHFSPRVTATGRSVAAMMRSLRLQMTRVSPADIPPTSRDPDDDVVLATALSAKARVIFLVIKICYA